MDYLSYILQHSHGSNFLLDETIIMYLVTELCSIGSMVHLLKENVKGYHQVNTTLQADVIALALCTRGNHLTVELVLEQSMINLAVIKIFPSLSHQCLLFNHFNKSFTSLTLNMCVPNATIVLHITPSICVELVLCKPT